MEKNCFMSISEMQSVLGVSRGKAYELANRQDFPALRIGKRIVIPVKQFEEWVVRQSSAQT